MKRIFLLLAIIFSVQMVSAQFNEPNTDTTWKTIYRGTDPKINALVHTKLDVKFDYDKQWMYGKEWVTLQPHFYATDSLTLDAKGMEIKEIAMVKNKTKVPLKYTYNGEQLRITLDKTYKGGEKYTVYIDYIAKPNEYEAHGSAAITDAKGLYFINPKGEKEGPTQIWTQGETEANSVWFPTIDRTYQKTTQELSMTVPAKYVTLSNGLLISQKKNADGTRTDTWKMDHPHSPYLFFMGVGEYAIVKDKYKNMSVDYYVEKEYEPVARKIFGETPRMIAFFEKITGVPYPWSKYAQIVGREYVSGAMENTTATLHQDGAQQDARQLVDGNNWENTIAHELFHQWFGDLVTAESWSNLTLNESFANYSEYLWQEHRYGKDYADQHAYEDMQGYLMSGSGDKDLVRFYYRDKEDMFDAVSYNKGGRILNMLRNYVGDSAFFKSLNVYLNAHKFQSAEAHDLRLAFEKVTGKDLNWFWNQWYFGNGNPELTIDYDYANGKSRVIISQTQKSGKIFQLPMAVDVYGQGGNKTRYQIWVSHASDTFYFPSATKPLLVNVDADKVILATKKDNKTAEEFEYQFMHAKNYLDRREALDYFAKNKLSALANGLNDPYSGIRLFTLEKINQIKGYTVPSVLTMIEQMASKDPNKKVQASALSILGKIKDEKYKSIFMKYLTDSSYSVSGAALEGLSLLSPAESYTYAKKYGSGAKGKLGAVAADIMYKNASVEDFDLLYDLYKNSTFTQSKIQASIQFANFLAKVKDADKVKKGVDEIMKFRNMIPEQYRSYIDPGFKKAFASVAEAQKGFGNAESAKYVESLIP